MRRQRPGKAYLERKFGKPRTAGVAVPGLELRDRHSVAALCYMQFKVAVPLTLGDVFETPLLTVTTKSAGAVAVIVEVPGVTHVALPLLSSMVATTVLDDFQVRPSAAVSWRLV